MKRFLIALGVVTVAIVAAGFVAGPYLDVLPSICPFRAITGRRCVLCGMSHAVASAVRGDFAGAAASHPAWFIVLPLFAVLVAATVSRRRRVSWSVVFALALGTLWTATLRP